MTAHRTNTLTVIIGCSYRPFPFDFLGITDLVELLTRVEVRLANLLSTISQSNENISNNSTTLIPSYKNWIVTMWHIGRDGKITYSGETFSIKWEIAKNTIIQIYSKQYRNGKRRIRMERQEYPNKKMLNLIEEKLSQRRSLLSKMVLLRTIISYFCRIDF